MAWGVFVWGGEEDIIIFNVLISIFAADEMVIFVL